MVFCRQDVDNVVDKQKRGTAHDTLSPLFVYLSPRSDVLHHRNALVPSLSFVIGVTTVRSLLRGTQNSD